MTRALMTALIVLIFASVSALTLFANDSPAPQLGHAPPTHAVGFEPYDNVPSHPPGTKRVRAMSASSSKAWTREASLLHGLACGGDLPPCAVLARESLMAEDPTRVWNGHCYYEPGYAGDNPCGSTASGKWQVLRSTWNGYAGFLNAADAPVDVQDAFARELWNGGLGCSHWAAC